MEVKVGCRDAVNHRGDRSGLSGQNGRLIIPPSQLAPTWASPQRDEESHTLSSIPRAQLHCRSSPDIGRPPLPPQSTNVSVNTVRGELRHLTQRRAAASLLNKTVQSSTKVKDRPVTHTHKHRLSVVGGYPRTVRARLPQHSHNWCLGAANGAVRSCKGQSTQPLGGPKNGAR